MVDRGMFRVLTARRPGGALIFIVATTSAVLGCGGCVRPSTGGEGGPASQSTSSPTSNGATRASDAARRYPLDSLPTARITVNGHELRVWVVREDDPTRPEVVQEGLMHVPANEIADDQGMLFVFGDERVRGFWMRNTITPLDIAYARMNGTIVKIAQMAPLTLRTYSSIEPAMFALEVKQGTLSRLGIKEGDRLIIPREVFTVK